MKCVALRKESVDRNAIRWNTCEVPTMSLSARRAWIEIRGARPIGSACPVALRKESVDRNNIRIAPVDGVIESLSARRAWIEISDMSDAWHRFTSLSARRAWIEMLVKFALSLLI